MRRRGFTTATPLKSLVEKRNGKLAATLPDPIGSPRYEQFDTPGLRRCRPSPQHRRQGCEMPEDDLRRHRRRGVGLRCQPQLTGPPARSSISVPPISGCSRAAP